MQIDLENCFHQNGSVPHSSRDEVAVSQPAIMARNVEMVFQSGLQSYKALKAVDLDLRAGQIQLLMGPSGSGKTTLLSILAGILTPTAGTVKLLGQEITGMGRKDLSRFRLENIGFVFQSFNLFPALTAFENVELALEIRGIKGKAARVRSQNLLEQVGLAGKGRLRPRDLSGGQKQRVAIARALVAQPKLLMADEPTASLDSSSGHAVIELLQHLAKEEGCTVLIVTHDNRIVDVADSVAYLEDGVICAPGLPK